MSSQYISILKLVGFIAIISAVSVVAIDKWNGSSRIYSWFVNRINPSDAVSVVLSVDFQPRLGAGINQSYALLTLSTSNLVKYKLVIEPRSCLSFDKSTSVYEITNETYTTIHVPVYLQYSSTCNDYTYKVTLYIFSQKRGSFIKAQTVEIVPEFDFTNVITVIPDGGTATVYESDLKDIARSNLLADYSSNIDKLRSRGVLIVSNINYPLVVRFETNGDKIYIASNKKSNVETISPVSNYTLLPGETVLVLPVKNSGSMLGYFENLKVGVFFGGKYKDFADLTVSVLPPTGLVGVAFQNTTVLIPVSRKKDYFLGKIATSSDYVNDAFDFNTFKLVPDLTVLSGGGTASSDWTVVETRHGSNWVEVVYAYKPDLTSHGISREYLAQRIEYEGHTVEKDSTNVYKYKVKSVMYFNADKYLTLFTSTVLNSGNANAFSSLLQYNLFSTIFDRNDWPKDRAMLITVPTFVVGVSDDVYKVEDISEDISVDKYSYRIWKFPSNVSGIWYVNYPELTLQKDYTPGTKAYTFVGNDQVVWKLIEAGITKGYFRLKSGQTLTRGLFDDYFDKIKVVVGDYDVGQTNEKCSLLDRVKDFDFDIQHLGCYGKKGKPSVVTISGSFGRSYVIAPVKLMLTYHKDFPDLTTGIWGHACRGAGGVMLEREDVISMLAPWTTKWCSGSGWSGKKANSLLNLKVNFNVKINVKVTNGMWTSKIVYDIDYTLIVYLPLLRPYWDSNYILYDSIINHR